MYSISVDTQFLLMMECLPTIRKLDCSATNMLLLTVCTPKDSDGGDDEIYIKAMTFTSQ